MNGIDVLLVEPYDLNNGIGHPVTGHFAPELEDIERVKETAANAGKKPGIYATSEDQARAYGDQAFDSVRSMATRRNLRSFLLMILLRSRWLPTVVIMPIFMFHSLKVAKCGCGHAAFEGWSELDRKHGL